MMLQAYVKWAQERSDFDNLSLFLSEFFKGKTDRQVFEHIMFELYNMAAVLGEVDLRICHLEHKEKANKSKPKEKKHVNGRVPKVETKSK